MLYVSSTTVGHSLFFLLLMSLCHRPIPFSCGLGRNGAVGLSSHCKETNGFGHHQGASLYHHAYLFSHWTPTSSAAAAAVTDTVPPPLTQCLPRHCCIHATVIGFMFHVLIFFLSLSVPVCLSLCVSVYRRS